jgi:hypothetical protein
MDYTARGCPPLCLSRVEQRQNPQNAGRGEQVVEGMVGATGSWRSGGGAGSWCGGVRIHYYWFVKEAGAEEDVARVWYAHCTSSIAEFNHRRLLNSHVRDALGHVPELRFNAILDDSRRLVCHTRNAICVRKAVWSQSCARAFSFCIFLLVQLSVQNLQSFEF